ncbi:MAG: hypothetical protein EOP00_03240 [Pedobacter sp.]|nr:MAG: hypothetical protein EOP00_03240 [Pedobacter sp.]
MEKKTLNKIIFNSLDFNKQDLVDALRNTITVIVPITLFFFLGFPSAALGIGTGSLLICLTDLPGSRSEKMIGALISIPTFFLVATLTALSVQHLIILPVMVFVLSFVLILFASLGQRMGVIGTMGLGIVAFTIGHHPIDPFEYGLYIGAGSLWYFLVSLSQAWIFPYHSLKRALAKTRKDTAALMRLRAIGYDPDASLSGFNAKNIKLHLKLTNDHELVRRLLLGDRFSTNFQDIQSKLLLKQSILLIDLFEQVSALHFDYQGIRKNLNSSGVLRQIKQAIEITADRLEGSSYNSDQYKKLIFNIESTYIPSPESKKLFNDILANLKKTAALVFSLEDKIDLESNMQPEEFPVFLTEGNFSFTKIRSHFNFRSQLFRFALRMSLLMFIVVVMIGFLPKGSYGYWLPITLIVISRPSYGMTMKRNIERILGTLLGLVLGWCLLELNLSAYIHLGIAVLSIFLFFTFLFLRYWVSAMGITLAVVLCLSLYHGHTEQILSERLLFTILGCFIGLVATFLFPVIHALNLKSAVSDAIITNLNYLTNVTENTANLIEVKLARKMSYLALSALNEAILLASNEPKWKRQNLKALKQIELLCFQLNALIAALPLGHIVTSESFTQIQKSIVIKHLNEVLEILANLHHSQIFEISPLQRLDGPLDLQNVSAKIKTIFAAN